MKKSMPMFLVEGNNPWWEKIRGLGKVLSILLMDLRTTFIHGCQPK
jgi:hypothetical protein